MTWKVVVSGRVQGVFFRASTKDKAVTLGLTGWVRNHPDGSVRMKVQGEEPVFRSFLDWVHQGPERAMVDHVDWNKVNEEKMFSDFRIKR